MPMEPRSLAHWSRHDQPSWHPSALVKRSEPETAGVGHSCPDG